jgi:hypothetical protein
MPSAPAFETAAASWGIAAMGAWTIGCSIPSSSHTGVVTAFAPSVVPGHTYDVGIDSDPRSQPWNFE